MSARMYANSASRVNVTGCAGVLEIVRRRSAEGGANDDSTAVSTSSSWGAGAGRERPCRPPRGAPFPRRRVRPFA